MKRKKGASLLLVVVMTFGLLVSACSPKMTQHKGTFITVDGVEVFNTVFTVMAYTKSEAEWKDYYSKIQNKVLKYHKLFDYYKTYEGVNNLKTINDAAGKAPVKVDPSIIHMIKFAQKHYEVTGRRTNIAMGAVTEIWHDAREKNAADLGETVPDAEITMPEMAQLQEAAKDIDFNNVVVDEAASTVFIKDPKLKLDLGALGKGYATELVAKEMAQEGMTNGLMSSGGNIKSIGVPDLAEKKSWTVGVTNPDQPGESLDNVFLELTGNESVVSSGDYERFFVYKGKRYHHIIDPDTLMPGNNFRQVTILTEDSGLADYLSTALYLLPLDKGQEVAKKLGVGVLWVQPDGRQVMNDAFKAKLKK